MASAFLFTACGNRLAARAWPARAVFGVVGAFRKIKKSKKLLKSA